MEPRLTKTQMRQWSANRLNAARMTPAQRSAHLISESAKFQSRESRGKVIQMKRDAQMIANEKRANHSTVERIKVEQRRRQIAVAGMGMLSQLLSQR